MQFATRALPPIASLLSGCLLAALLPTPALAAVPTLAHSAFAADTAAPPIAISGRERGLAEVDGELWAVGATYKARFERGAVTIVPPLGPDAPRSLPLVLAFDSAWMAGRRLDACAGASAPRAGEFEVRYDHAAGVVERYAVRSAALEQTFTLETLPDERGELVVRLRVATELVPRADGAGLRFEDARGRGLCYGALTAIDARGRSSAGALQLEHGVLELRVPAEFMSVAEAPLLLDPAIGGALDVSPGSGDFQDPDVSDPDVPWSTDDTPSMVVYERHWSATDIDVYGQKFKLSTAQLVGSTILYEPTVAQVARNPVVAFTPFQVAATGEIKSAYYAVWQQGTSPPTTQHIVGRGSDAATSALFPSASIAIGSLAVANVDPDIARVSFGFLGWTQELAIVWEADQGIRCRIVRLVSTTGPPLMDPTIVVSSGLRDTHPAVSGTLDRAVIVWERFFTTPAPGDHDLVGVLINTSTSTVLGPEAHLQTTIGPDEQHPRVKMAFFLDDPPFVVYSRRSSSTSLDRDIFALTAQEGTSSLGPISSPISLKVAAGSDDHDPVVSWMSMGGSSALRLRTAYVHDSSGGFGSVVNAIGVTQGAYLCQGAASPPVHKISEFEHQVAGAATGIDFPSVELDGDVLVYESFALGIFAQAVPGSVGGGSVNPAIWDNCPGGGKLCAECPVAPNSNFAHALSGASPLQPAFLILSFDLLEASCGTCTLAPDPFSGFVISGGSTDAAGFAKLPMPIPNSASLLGIEFYHQWAVVPGANPCPTLGATLSNGVKSTIAL